MENLILKYPSYDATASCFASLFLAETDIYGFLFLALIAVYFLSVTGLVRKNKQGLTAVAAVFAAVSAGFFIDFLAAPSSAGKLMSYGLLAVFSLAAFYTYRNSGGTFEEGPEKQKMAAGPQKLYIGFAAGLLLFTVIRRAWVCDDAYIVFRTVDNFVNGMGLRWNVAERVQTFTDPLWMFTVSAAYYFWRQPFFAAVALNIIFTMAAVYILWKLSSGRVAAAFCVTAALVSKAFVDFATSGLENSMAYFLMALFFWVYMKEKPSFKRAFLLGLTAALAGLNRLDSLVFYIVPAAAELMGYRKKGDFAAFFLGTGPLLAWWAFAVFYFGFAFPNTYYAKTRHGIQPLQLIMQGLEYFRNSLRLDTVTLLVTGAAAVSPFLHRKLETYDKRPGYFSASLVLYALYVLMIGGDFMSGRFFAPSFFMALLILSRTVISNGAAGWSLALPAVMLLGFFPSEVSLTSDRMQRGVYNDKNSGIVSEREWYFNYSSLQAVLWEGRVPTLKNDPAMAGLYFRKQAEKKAIFLNAISIGFVGFYAGPRVYLVDHVALADPLLARLPVSGPVRIGHFERILPEGYLDTLKNGKNVIKDRSLAQYYDKLSLITRGPLFDGRRLAAIFEINTGKYDHLIKEYLKNTNAAPPPGFRRVTPAGTAVGSPG